MRQRLALHSVELGQGGAPEWVHLLPLGRFSGRDGRGPYELRDQAHARQVIADTRAYHQRADIPVDYDHQLIWVRQNGRPAIAAGWVKELEVRDDGIWGRVEWTEAAAQHIAQREYRYLSPVFGHSRDGRITRLFAVSLVNNPNLELTALASATIPEEEDDSDMDELLKRLRALFGLADDADADAIVAHAQGLAEKAAAHAKDLAAIAQALKVEDRNATAETIVAAAQQVQEKIAGGQPDPSQYVPMSQFQALADELATLRKDVHQRKVEEVVEAASRAGKLAPSMREWGLAYASKDLEGFTKWAEAAPVIAAPPGAPAPGKPKNQGELDDEDMAVCNAMGLDPEEFKKNKEA